MRHLVFCLILFPILSWSQNSTVFQLWNEVGVAYKVDKKQSLAFDLTTRYSASGLQTFFPQISYKYKINKLIRPSIDYRFIGDRNQEGNFTYQHRLNANLQFAHSIDKLQFGLRLRYQYTTNRFAENYEPEFGEAFRLKPSISYNIKKSDFEPQASMEFFTGPMDGQTGYHLNRIRWSVGFAYTFEDNHSLELAYLYDQRIMSSGALNRAILNLSYGYSIGDKKNKAPVKPQRTGRFL